MIPQRADLTFKENLKRGRHGWMRLTPAYSVKIVLKILDEHPGITSVIDPFSGTGTTGLVAAQRGLRGGLVDINPFLIWLAHTKTTNYPDNVLTRTRQNASEIIQRAENDRLFADMNLWIPPIANVDRWWIPERADILARVFDSLQHICPDNSQIKDLLQIAFCKLIIDWSNAAFNHQSMSFKDADNHLEEHKQQIFRAFTNNVEQIIESASEHLDGIVDIYHTDSRLLNIPLSDDEKFDCVITSPPYSNRMSYIRELRPYMYWLGYLVEARDAGELDWKTIGGTWGIATSRLNDWRPSENYDNDDLLQVVEAISDESDVLSSYVHKYHEDMYQHFSNLHKVLRLGGKVFYIVGNSKFYNTLVCVEQFYENMMESLGFTDIGIEVIRKRNSKKELYEYLVTGTRV